MSASHLPAVRATAMQAAVALARYERHVRRLSATWLNMELYRTVSDEADEIRSLCANLPQMSGPHAELLISHAELIHALWRRGDDSTLPAEEVTCRLAEHLLCIDALARSCLRTAERPFRPLA
jgi:hypothetical protein